jgi:hypothetical protein
MRERLMDVMKWGLILIIAGVVFYLTYTSHNRYVLVGGGDRPYAYKMHKRTGQLWWVIAGEEKEITLTRDKSK